MSNCRELSSAFTSQTKVFKMHAKGLQLSKAYQQVFLSLVQCLFKVEDLRLAEDEPS